MMRQNRWLAVAIAGLVVLLVIKGWFMNSTQTAPFGVPLLKVSFGRLEKLPDPSNIQTAGQWYLLNHVSSPLIQFDFTSNSFLPLLAEKWEIEGNKYTFHLKKDARFSDGSPLTAMDLAVSIKRMLLLKTASHFPLWEYVEGCGSLSNLNDECTGVQVLDKHTLQVVLSHRRESFLLQMASPEGAVWSQLDIDPKTLRLIPTRFSGPYSLRQQAAETKSIFLEINKCSPIAREYTAAPKVIQVLPMDRKTIEESLLAQQIDVFIGDYIPFNAINWENENVGVHLTTPSSILYLFQFSKHPAQRLSKSFIEAVWSMNDDKNLIAAETFLPFGSLGAINKFEYLSTFQDQELEKTIRIAAPNVYFQTGFLEFLKKAGARGGQKIEVDVLPPGEFFALFEADNTPYDFALSTYVASERYPAVQLRFLLNGKAPPFKFDLKELDLIEESETRLLKIAAFQKNLLKTQMVVPLFFVRTHIVSNKRLNIGDQPRTDAEIQLWKIKLEGGFN